MINKLRFYQEIDMYDHQSHLGSNLMAVCVLFTNYIY